MQCQINSSALVIDDINGVKVVVSDFEGDIKEK